MFSRLRILSGKINNWRYCRLASKAEKPYSHSGADLVAIQQSLKEDGYFSQAGQDKWLVNTFFPYKEKGTFVDIGANDGITFSNSYLLEKNGWDGIAVEPIFSAYKKLVENRKCIAVNGCIAPKSGKQKFRVISGRSEMLSGLVREYDPRHLKRIANEINLYGGKYEEIDVYCYNINELLNNYNISYVDYLNIDVEGIEYEILKSINFNDIQISVISVENNYRDHRIPGLLIGKGFIFHSIVGDEFYLNYKIP